MKDNFKYILDNYLSDSSSLVNSKSKLYQTICHVLPNEIKNIVGDNFKVKGSMGQGQKCECPWISILNNNITTSTTNGIYVVYIFKKDMTGFYLCLNQGITNFEKLFKKKKYEYASKVGSYFKNEINDAYFTKSDILLGNVSKSSLAYGYQKANVISKYYPKDNYSEGELIDDLKRMISIYDEIAKLFVNRNYDTLIKNIINDDNDVIQIVNGEEAIEQIKEYVQDNSNTTVNVTKELIKQIPYIDKTSKFQAILNPKTSNKIDYVKMTYNNMKIGLEGEGLVIEYEMEKLRKLGREDLASKVKWLSKESDSYGYDILSYDVDSKGKVHEIYIEVKTTSSQYDTEFFISKNEVEASDKLKDRYCLFRIYDAQSLKPKFYKAYGEVSKNFNLNPVTYMAKYKFIQVR